MKKIFKWIDQTPNEVNMSSRLYAYLIDWIVGGVLCAFPAVVIYGLITRRSDVFTDLYVFPALGYSQAWSYLGGILCIAAALVYFIYIPYKKFDGQTLGKKIMKIKIVNKDGSRVTLHSLFVRQFVGLIIMESGAVVVGGYLRQMATLALSFDVDSWWQMTGSILIIVSALLMIATLSHRALHDYLAHTKVISV